MLQMMGDSKLVVDWVNRKVLVTDIRLSMLLQNIQLSLASLDWYSCNHILRKINEKANTLSKESLALPTGACGIYEF
jgi:hypothetical protein